MMLVLVTKPKGRRGCTYGASQATFIITNTHLPDHLGLQRLCTVCAGASRRDADGAVAAADGEAVRRRWLDGQRIRVAAKAAESPLHLHTD
jgi:hypothetical protein